MDVPAQYSNAGAAAARRVRNDLLTSIAAVTRETTARHPEVIVGTGQRGVVAAKMGNRWLLLMMQMRYQNQL